jgi:hypothetical protein
MQRRGLLKQIMAGLGLLAVGVPVVGRAEDASPRKLAKSCPVCKTVPKGLTDAELQQGLGYYEDGKRLGSAVFCKNCGVHFMFDIRK